MRKKSLAERFWKYVDKSKRNGCWLWTGYVDPAGYGKMSFNLKPSFAHRISWLIAHGALDSKVFVLHACDNPRCVRPDHLFLGTQKDNMRDMHRKGRAGDCRNFGVANGIHNHPEKVRGELNGCAKLTWRQVKTMREEYATGRTSTRKLARKFGVAQCTVWRALAERNWVQ